MPRFSERRGERRQNDDSYDPERGWRRREDGPWSPYNGSKRSHPHDERRFDERGRDYWRENEDESPREWYEPPGVSHRRERDDFSYGRERDRERWDDRGMRPSDDWSYREHLHDPITEGEPSWGNEMGMRGDQPSGRSIPRGPDWQSEPHPSEAWIAREDRYRERSSYDDRMREAAGEQYPGQRDFDQRREQRDMRERDMRGGYGRDMREQRGGYGRDMRDREQREMRDREMRDMRDREMRDREQRDMRDREMRDREQRDMRDREMRGREQRDIRSGYGHDMRDREYGRDTGAHRDFGRERDMRGPRDYEAREREQRDLRERERRDYREMRDEREQRRDTRDQRHYAEEPGRDLGSFEGDHGRWTRRAYDVDNRDVRADDSHELRRDRGKPWHGSETRGSDEYGRGLEQRSPEDRFRAENREWTTRISGSDRGRHR